MAAAHKVGFMYFLSFWGFFFLGGGKFAFLLTLYSMIVAGVDVCADQNVRRSLNFIGQRQEMVPFDFLFFFCTVVKEQPSTLET